MWEWVWCFKRPGSVPLCSSPTGTVSLPRNGSTNDAATAAFSTPPQLGSSATGQLGTGVSYALQIGGTVGKLCNRHSSIALASHATQHLERCSTRAFTAADTRLRPIFETSLRNHSLACLKSEYDAKTIAAHGSCLVRLSLRNDFVWLVAVASTRCL
jgi:hypothetical protein